MNAKIYVPIEDSWDFFEDHHTRLKKELIEIASYDDTVVYMTESNDMPQLVVEIAGKEIENLSILSSSELMAQLEKMYSDYILFPEGGEDSDVFNDKAADNDAGADPIDDAIMRDDELICATDDFLCATLSVGEYKALFDGFGFDMQREVLGDICDMLEEKYGVNIYWPVIVEDESGNETVIERKALDRRAENDG